MLHKWEIESPVDIKAVTAIYRCQNCRTSIVWNGLPNPDMRLYFTRGLFWGDASGNLTCGDIVARQVQDS
jgi:hypothetical protein